MTTNIQANVSIGGSFIYRSKVLLPKNGMLLTLDMVLEPNTKYIIKNIFDLNNQSILIPKNSIIEIDGGQLKNGTLVGDLTILLNPNGVASIVDNVAMLGTWDYRGNTVAGPQGPPGRSLTYEDLTSSLKQDLIDNVFDKVVDNIHLSYPDITTEPTDSMLDIQGVPILLLLIPALTSEILGNYYDINEVYFDLSKLPLNCTILECFIFNDEHTESALCFKNDGKWNIVGSNSDFSPDYALIRYY